MKLSGQRGQCRGINDIHQIDQQRRQVDLRKAFGGNIRQIERSSLASGVTESSLSIADPAIVRQWPIAFRPFVLPAIPFSRAYPATS